MLLQNPLPKANFRDPASPKRQHTPQWAAEGEAYISRYPLDGHKHIGHSTAWPRRHLAWLMVLKHLLARVTLRLLCLPTRHAFEYVDAVPIVP